MDQDKIDYLVKDSFKFVKNKNNESVATPKLHNVTVESKDDGYDDTVSFLINEEVVSRDNSLVSVESGDTVKESQDKVDDTVSFIVNEVVVENENYFTNKKYNDISLVSTLSTMSIEDSAAKSTGKKFEKQQKIKRRLSFKTCLNDEEFYGPGNRNFFSLRNRLGLRNSRRKSKPVKDVQKIGFNNNLIKESDESKLTKKDHRFTCKLCGKRFAAKGSLGVHMKTHTEGLPIGTRAGKLEEQMMALQRRLSMINKK